MKSYFICFFLILIGLVGKVSAERFSITLNDHEKHAIREILVSMGEKNWAKLLFESRKLSSLGGKIQHVHPLQFLGYILSEHRLRECLRKSSKNYFKWSAFMDGLRPKMERELHSGSLMRELSSFAEFVGGDPRLLETFCEHHSWDEFVKCLL